MTENDMLIALWWTLKISNKYACSQSITMK